MTDDRSAVADREWSDDELAELAMAATPVDVFDDSAEPWRPDGGLEQGALLPEWYMPVPQAGGRTPGRMFAVAAIIGALLIVNGAGLCVTYGFPEIAW
ncbi:MAG: hypothetical protein AAGF73_06235 [Actinomycetota bacterium]